MRRGDIGRYQVAVGVVALVGDALHRHDAGEIHTHFKRAVLMEDPLETVLVIAGLAPVGNHQLACPPGVVGVLPLDTAIALEARHGARYDARFAGAFCHYRVVHAAIRRTIDSRPQGTGGHSEPEFAHIEAVAEKPTRGGIAVGHHHFRRATRRQYITGLRTFAAVLIADGVKRPRLRADGGHSGSATSASEPRHLQFESRGRWAARSPEAWWRAAWRAA